MGNLGGQPANPRALAFLIAAGLILLAIGLPAPVVRAAPPTLQIVSPSEGAVIGNASPVAIVFAATEFNLTEPGTAPPGPNQGHVQVFVNDALVGLAFEPTIVLPLPPGVHTIRLRLVDDNGTGLSPEVTDSVRVTATRGPAGGTPGVLILHPANGTEQGRDSAVSFQLRDFALVPPGGPAGVPNEGHVLVLLDDVPYQILTKFRPVLFSDVHDGWHRVTLRLVDNAGQPLSPDVSATVHFRVVSSGGIDFTIPLLSVNGVLAAIVILALYYPYYPIGRKRT